MATQKINFTKAAIERIKPPVKPEGKKSTVYDKYYDLKEKGLVLMATSGGAKTFYLYKKVQGKPERVRLGSFPDMKVEQARKAAVANRNIINEGKNPNVEKKKIRQEITFGELFNDYMEKYSKKMKRSWKYDEREVNKFLSHWFSRKVSSISKIEIQELHQRIGEQSGIYQANRILERIRAIYNKGIEWGLEIANPSIGIKKFKEQSRERFLQADELPAFWQAVAEEENETARDYVIISLLSGARKSNVLAMRWEQINLERMIWTIPVTKNGESQEVPITPEMLEVLEPRRQGKFYGWVFPSKSSASGHLADPKKAWRRILEHATLLIWQRNKEIGTFINSVQVNMPSDYTPNQLFHQALKQAERQNIILPTGVTDVRLHDLRRTLGSWQANTGATTAMIGKSLGHKSQQATAVYERLNIDPIRESVERATEAMMADRRVDNHAI